jgi:hypothetical protein
MTSEFVQAKRKNQFFNPSAKRSCTQGFIYIIQLTAANLKVKIYSVLCWYIMRNICLNGTFRFNWKVEDTARKQQKIYRWNVIILWFSVLAPIFLLNQGKHLNSSRDIEELTFSFKILYDLIKLLCKIRKNWTENSI